MKKRWGSKIMSGPGDTRGRGVLGHDRVPPTLAVVLYLKKKYCFIPIPWLPTVLIIPLQQWLLMQLLLLIPLLQLDAHFYYHYYYRSRCYGMTGVSPHSDTFFLHQLPDPGWSPGRQAGYPGAGREGYWATHQNTGACCWHGSLKSMEGDYKTTEIDTLPDKG